jgi:hypothetical protein
VVAIGHFNFIQMTLDGEAALKGRPLQGAVAGGWASGPQGQGWHLPVFWTSYQVQAPEPGCKLKVSQSKG